MDESGLVARVLMWRIASTERVSCHKSHRKSRVARYTILVPLPAFLVGSHSARLIGVGALFGVAFVAAILAFVALGHGPASIWTLDAFSPMLRLEFGVVIFAAPFMALLALVAIPVGIWSLHRGRAIDVMFIAAFAAAMLLVLLARSVTAFFLAWEAMSIVSAFLVAAHHERRDVRRATLTYIIVAQSGALCILVALVLLAINAGTASFAGIAAGAPILPAGIRDAVFAFALIGFGSKAGLMPLHFWLPRAHPVAPPNASAMLSGVMLKIAIYGLALVMLELAAPATTGWGIAIMLIGAASAVGGVLYALVDHDLKRLLAYHSVENIGIIAIGLGVALTMQATGAYALAALALMAALFHTINHGLFKSLLFLGAGTVADSAGTVDLERLGGLWADLVWTAPLFLIGCAAISALPPFNGFVSEWMTFQSLIAGITNAGLAVKLALIATIAALALTSGLAAACFVKVFGVAFLGRAREARTAPRERFDPSAAALALLAIGCVTLGIVPMLAIVPLAHVAQSLFGTSPLALPTGPALPAFLIVLPALGAFAAYALARRRGIRAVATWTCGSPVTVSAQYSATGFSKPLRTIFAFFLAPERRRVVEVGFSSWFPRRITYRTTSRYLIDEVARRFSAALLLNARRMRLVQSGSLQLYLMYAILTMALTLVVTR